MRAFNGTGVFGAVSLLLIVIAYARVQRRCWMCDDEDDDGEEEKRRER